MHLKFDAQTLDERGLYTHMDPIWKTCNVQLKNPRKIFQIRTKFIKDSCWM